MRTFIILAAMVFIFCTAAFSDTIYLQDGSEINGEIISIDGDLVTIKTLEDTFTIKKYRIKKVEPDKDEDKRIEEERPENPAGPQWDRNWN